MGSPLAIGLYSPYFGSTYGGGEAYLAMTARVLKDRLPDASVEIACPVPVDRARYEERLDLDLRGIGFRSTNRRVTPVHRFLNRLQPLRPLRNRVLGGQAARLSGAYDVFLPMVYRIPVSSAAPTSVMLCQFPYPDAGRELDAFGWIVCQSEYVRDWVGRYWGRTAAVVHPPVEVPAAEPDWEAKERVLLSVGRFIAGGHNKRQDVMVAAFRSLCDAGLEGWELHLAGGVHRDAEHAGLFESLVADARGYPVFFHPDVARPELEALFRRAAVYWHAAGYGAGDPEAFEHFGMTTVEAMARGAVPVVFGGGGQLEVVADGVNGRLWSEPGELVAATAALVADPTLRRRLGERARADSRRYSRARFRAAMAGALAEALEGQPLAAG